MPARYSRYYTAISPIIRHKQVRIYSPLIFSLILITIFTFFALRPTITTIITLQNNINEQKQVLSQLQLKAENLSKGKRNYDLLNDSTKNTLITLVPDKSDIPTLVSVLSGIARQYEASISGLQVQPTQLFGTQKQLSSKGILEEINFTFNVTAPYEQLVSILDHLRVAPRLLNLESVGINKQEGNNLTMTVNGKAYLLR